MAIYHLHVKVLTRSKGHSAIKAAAYRSGTALKDIDGEKVDYSRRADVTRLPIIGEILPDWAKDRQTLWESVERAEKRKDAQLAREVEVALPIELSDDEKKIIVERFSRYLSVMYGGVPVDAVIHNKPGNPHAHLLIPTRELTPDGWGQKDRSKNNPEIVKAIRKQWADISNEYLVKYQQQIDHRSYKERGIDKVPQVHLGKKKFWSEIRRAIKIGIDEVLDKFDAFLAYNKTKPLNNTINAEKLDKIDINSFIKNLKPDPLLSKQEIDRQVQIHKQEAEIHNNQIKKQKNTNNENETTGQINNQEPPLQVPQQEPEKKQTQQKQEGKRDRSRGRGMEW